jgi:hypothetical protein
MPSTKEIAIKPPAITRPQGEPLFRMGAPPDPGSAPEPANAWLWGTADLAVGAREVGVCAIDIAGGVPDVAVGAGVWLDGVDVAGGETRIPTLDRPLILKIPPRTNARRSFRLRGKGMPHMGDPKTHGDLFALVRLVLPEPLTDKDVISIRELASSRSKHS